MCGPHFEVSSPDALAGSRPASDTRALDSRFHHFPRFRVVLAQLCMFGIARPLDALVMRTGRNALVAEQTSFRVVPCSPFAFSVRHGRCPVGNEPCAATSARRIRRRQDHVCALGALVCSFCEVLLARLSPGSTPSLIRWSSGGGRLARLAVHTVWR